MAASASAIRHGADGPARTRQGRGWGSVRLRIRIGASAWQTSAFPSKEQGWIVPVKAAVRRAEGLTEGDAVTVELQF
jgi:hypothetical protein